MKTILGLLMALALAGCDAGTEGSSSGPQAAAAPQPVPVEAPIAPNAQGASPTADEEILAADPTPLPYSFVQLGSKPVVFIGDSIIYRWGNLCANFVSCSNMGIGGQTTQQMLDRFQHDVLSQRPSVVVIEGGINDMIKEVSPSTDAIAQMASMAAAAGAKVIICGVIPAYWGHASAAAIAPAAAQVELDAYNASLVAMAAAYGYTFVDFHAALLNPDGTEDLGLFTSDWIHPNDAGYKRLWAFLDRSHISE